MPPAHNDDPITGKSLSGPILILTAVMLLTTFWALYDEFYTMRPWKAFQESFVQKYSAFLQAKIPERARAEEKMRKASQHQSLLADIQAAEEVVGLKVKEIDDEVRLLNRNIATTQAVFMVERARVGAKVYLAEVATSEDRRESILADVEEIKSDKHDVKLATVGGGTETVEQNYDEMESELARLKNRKAERITERLGLLAKTSGLRADLRAYEEEQLGGLSVTSLEGLLNKMRTFKIDIKQIHIKEGDLVERCESCHLGIREPLTLTAADMGEAAFISHPNPGLLSIHDPEAFGCSTCHGGNGRATSSVVKGHGRHKYWLWPMHQKANYEAGCQQCHRNDFVIDYADTLNRGKELYRLNGCIGCHRYEGFDNQDEQFTNAVKTVELLTNRRRDMLLDIGRSNRAADNPDYSLEEARQFLQRAINLRVKISDVDAEINVLRARSAELLKEIKKTGPNLKDLKAKVNPDWLPVWIGDPHQWRPTTKMPAFRLEQEEVRALSAYLWQNGSDVQLPRQPRGNAARGQQAFESRGCLACHSIGEGDGKLGGYFAANLSRVGEKVNYDFLVRWIRNPRERLRPYCPEEKRDLTRADYARHGLPFQWDIEGDTCPNDGSPLMVMNQTIMPSLRLTMQETRDIASYLMTQTQQARSGYAKADFLDDPQLAEAGRGLIRQYGCAGCHEIAGFETEPRIGTELTLEGSKPIERLDFALKGHEAERSTPGWYNHKGFFERKLTDPGFFDEGKIKAPAERLRMPRPNIDQAGVDALTTLLLGSVTPTIPESLQHLPGAQGQDVQEGWWIVTKYNCMGCHQVRIGKDSILMGLPAYQGNKEALPPSLIGVGARLNPEWMRHFLADPALSETNTNRNGIREYLQVRMPTFYLSVEEIRKLVRFFQAISSQPMPYIPGKQAPLTNTERQIARQLFTHQAAPCLRCHAVGNPVRDRNATAPNFLTAAERLKPAWTKRWLLDPASIMPGTAMPSGLFRQEGNRSVFNAKALPALIRNYPGDHAELLVRYMFELTPAEQRLLVSRMASASPPVSPRTSGTVAGIVKSH